MNSKQKTGFFEILFAVGVLTLMGIAAGSLRYFANLQNRRIIERENRQEAFYSSELAAWHSAVLTATGGTPSASQDAKGRYIASIDNQYDSGLPFLIDTYNPVSYQPGDPLNIKSTMSFDLGRTFIRRYQTLDDQLLNIRYTVQPVSREYCGQTAFLKSNAVYRTCLADMTMRLFFLKSTGEIFFIDSNSTEAFECGTPGVCDTANFAFMKTKSQTHTFHHGGFHWENGVRSGTREVHPNTLAVAQVPGAKSKVRINNMVIILDSAVEFTYRLRNDGRLQIQNFTGSGLIGNWLDLTYNDVVNICNPDPACDSCDITTCLCPATAPASCGSDPVTLLYAKSLAIEGVNYTDGKSKIIILESSGYASGSRPRAFAAGDLTSSLVLQGIAFETPN